MDYSAILAILAILSMFWAMMRVVLTAFAALNERRDVIAIGYLDGQPITYEHRMTIFFHDWLPLSSAAILFMIIVGIIIGDLPSLILADTESVISDRMRTLAKLAVIMPFVLTAAYIVTTLADIVFIGKMLSKPKTP